MLTMIYNCVIVLTSFVLFFGTAQESGHFLPRECHNATEFKCADGKCIPASWRCDGDHDCMQGEDEKNCNELVCDTQQDFRCAGENFGLPFYGGIIRERFAQCIPQSWVCDGEADCKDASDERNCGNKTCEQDQFECPEYGGNFKVCLPISWKCDGQNDCTNGTDEKDCENKNRTCADNEFQCLNGVCIIMNWRCDGDDDCGDNSDEKGCPANKCDSKTKFQCKSDSMCISLSWVCDGENDCPDRSDEADCASVTRPLPPHTMRCHDNEFKCHSEMQCISNVWKCDGEKDCRDGSDELDCDTPKCRPNEKKCGNGICIAQSKWCDGVEDCADGSDEKNCSYPESPKADCDEWEYKCPGMPAQCVSYEVLCTKKNISNTDCAKSVCSTDIKLCDERNQFCKCRQLGPKARLCYCPRGFRRQGDKCVDIDECETVGVCPQKCINTEGGYTCECYPGYRLSLGHSMSDISNGKFVGVCRATGSDPLLILSSKASIRRYDLVRNEYKPLVAELASVVAMDFLHKTGALIWSDVSEEKLMICHMGNKSSLLGLEDCQEKNTDNLTLVAQDIDTPDGLAVDWVHQLLFWTDTGLDQISVLDLATRRRRVLFKDNVDEPRAIAVDPSHGLIFWTDWGKKARIERAGMDGSNRKAIVSGENVQWPNGLALDIPDHRLYWADAKAKVIMSCDYNGDKIKLVLSSHDLLRHPFSLTVFEDRLYWTDWDHQGVVTANKFTGKEVKTIMTGVPGPMTVRVYHEVVQPDHPNKCWNHGCDHLCLPRPHFGELQEKVYSRELPYVCACANGYVVKADNQNYCITEDEFKAGLVQASTAFSLTTIFFFLLLSVFSVAGYLWYRRRPSRFVILHVDNPVYRRTVEEVDADMEAFADGPPQQNGAPRDVKLVFEGEQRERVAPPLTESMTAPLTSSMVL